MKSAAVGGLRQVRKAKGHEGSPRGQGTKSCCTLWEKRLMTDKLYPIRNIESVFNQQPIILSPNSSILVLIVF